MALCRAVRCDVSQLERVSQVHLSYAWQAADVTSICECSLREYVTRQRELTGSIYSLEDLKKRPHKKQMFFLDQRAPETTALCSQRECDLREARFARQQFN